MLSAPAGAAGARRAGASFHDGSGLKVLGERRLDARLLELTVKTGALPQPANVRILLPSGYGQHPRRRYPVLYLLHGTSGHASDWTSAGDAERTTAGRSLIVVMPDIALNGDGGGWCTDWPNGAERWETFHVKQLIPWVDGNLRTLRSRTQRAIAGLSQGGFCSMSYAARHPDLFATALAYSGAPDIYYDQDARTGGATIINATELGLDRVPPNTYFGDQTTDGINWAAHDPATLAPNLRATRLYLYFGNGSPGPYDDYTTDNAGPLEAAVHQDNVDFHNRLTSLGIPSLYDDYGPGTHTWPYWARDLRWSIGAVMRAFTKPARSSPAFSYTSADDAYSVYGWSVRMHRQAREFSGLLSARGRGFTLTGSGSATVVTAPLYRSGARYGVTIAGHRRALVARRRRLTIEVTLGPSNPYQQDTLQAQAAGTKVYATPVAITSLSRR